MKNRSVSTRLAFAVLGIVTALLFSACAPSALEGQGAPNPDGGQAAGAGVPDGGMVSDGGSTPPDGGPVSTPPLAPTADDPAPVSPTTAAVLTIGGSKDAGANVEFRWSVGGQLRQDWTEIAPKTNDSHWSHAFPLDLGVNTILLRSVDEGDRVSATNTSITVVREGGEISPVIRVIGYDGGNPAVSGMAPLAVNVDGLSTVLGAGDELSARYTWDFGDGSGPHNQLVGWTAGHVYDVPGSYTLTLAVTNERFETATQEITVQVSADTRQVFHVSPLGRVGGVGSLADPGSTPGDVNGYLADDVTILFERGQVHDFATDSVTVEGVSGVVLGAYGSGDAPVLMGAAYPDGVNRSLISVLDNPSFAFIDGGWIATDTPAGPPIDQVVIQDLEFRSLSEASLATEWNNAAVQVHGRRATNITIRRNTCDDIGSCILMGQGAYPLATEEYNYPGGVLIVDNTADALSSYFTFFSAHHVSLIGNLVTGGSYSQWIFRYYADYVLIANNDFQQPVSNYQPYAVAGGVHCAIDYGTLLSDCDGPTGDDVPGHQGNVEWGHHSYVVGNRLDDTLRLGYVGFGSNGTKFQSQRYVVVENNLFTRVGANQAPTETLYHWPYTRHVRIRNNVFLGPYGNAGFTPEGVWDFEVAHNTYYGPASDHTFALIVNRYGDDGVPAMDFMFLFGSPATTAGAFQVVNNLFAMPAYSAGGGSGPYLFSSTVLPDLTGFAFSGNIWPGGGASSNLAMNTGLGVLTPTQWSDLPQVDGDTFQSFSNGDFLLAPPAPDAPEYKNWLPELVDGHGAAGTARAHRGVYVDFAGNPRPRDGGWTAGALESE